MPTKPRGVPTLDRLEPRVLLAAAADFNGDGKDDLLWRNQETGANVVWYSGSRFSTAPVQGLLDTDWVIGEVRDFNGDAKADIVWRNIATGANAIWLMEGRSRAESVALPALLDPAWRIRAAGDFDGDGDTDIFWRNLFTGANALWIMENLERVDVLALPGEPSNTWEVAGAADYDHDGDDDVYWVNTNYDRAYGPGSFVPVRFWKFQGGAVQSVVHASTASDEYQGRAVAVREFYGEGILTSVVVQKSQFKGDLTSIMFSGSHSFDEHWMGRQSDLRWHAKDRLSTIVRGDLNGDGFVDVIARNAATGELEAVNVNPVTGATRVAALPGVPSSEWKVALVHDYLVRGWHDLILRNTVTGQTAWWMMNGLSRWRGSYLPSLGAQWEITGAHDFDGNGYAEFILANRDTSQVVAWKLLGFRDYVAIPIGYLPGPGYALASMADFNGDGKADLIWRDAAADSTLLWSMNRLERTGSTTVGSPGPDWILAAAADFDQDREIDLLWRHPSNGSTRLWRMDGATRIETIDLPHFDPAATLVGARDLGGDGGVEIVFHNAASGAVRIWRMQGTTRVGSLIALSRPAPWSVLLPG